MALFEFVQPDETTRQYMLVAAAVAGGLVMLRGVTARLRNLRYWFRASVLGNADTDDLRMADDYQPGALSRADRIAQPFRAIALALIAALLVWGVREGELLRAGFFVCCLAVLVSAASLLWAMSRSEVEHDEFSGLRQFGEAPSGFLKIHRQRMVATLIAVMSAAVCWMLLQQ